MQIIDFKKASNIMLYIEKIKFYREALSAKMKLESAHLCYIKALNMEIYAINTDL